MFQNMSAYMYILVGLFITLFFGGTLILQLLGVISGLLMVRHGVMMLSWSTMFKGQFRSFDDIRYR